jgi:hypothetical protein
MVRFTVRLVVFIESRFVVLSHGSSIGAVIAASTDPPELPIPTTEPAAFPFTC